VEKGEKAIPTERAKEERVTKVERVTKEERATKEKRATEEKRVTKEKVVKAKAREATMVRVLSTTGLSCLAYPEKNTVSPPLLQAGLTLLITAKHAEDG